VWILTVLKEPRFLEKKFIFRVSLRNAAEDKLLRAGRVGQLNYYRLDWRRSGAISDARSHGKVQGVVGIGPSHTAK